MHASVKQERMARNEVEARVGLHEGRGRGRRADGSRPSLVNELDPEQHQMEENDVKVENTEDDELPREERLFIIV
jgi:hypothetical protein